MDVARRLLPPSSNGSYRGHPFGWGALNLVAALRHRAFVRLLLLLQAAHLALALRASLRTRARAG